jgi:hypothetical protein
VTLALKILLSPACVVVVSMIGRRWGLAVAGLLGGLPVVAGPILLVETLQHGRGFGAEAAAGTLLGLVALTAFVVIYGRAATATGPILCLLAGWTAFLLVVAVLDRVHPPAGLSLILAGSAFALGLRLLPTPRTLPPALVRPRWWDLPARAVSALSLVLLLTGISAALGPHLSGLLAPFPIITSVLAVFSHGEFGAERTLVLLRNFLLGFYGFAAFCFVLATSLPSLTTAAAFSLAVVAAPTAQAAVFFLRPAVGRWRRATP